jgi:hypothetical protein
MRSSEPFFEQILTQEVIRTIAEVDGTLAIYCGAGVTIDMTGHNWSALVRAMFPVRRLKSNQEMPTQSEVARLGSNDSPEALASSLVHHLRIANAHSSRTLKDGLRTGLRRLLYDKSTWQRGALAKNIVYLSVGRAIFGRKTQFFTSNYDTHIENEYVDLRDKLLTLSNAFVPGLRLFTSEKAEPHVLHEPVNADLHVEGSQFIDVHYLHGRLPSMGPVSWPLVLDEKRYAESSLRVEAELCAAFRGAEKTLIVGSSLVDLPLVRALSATRDAGGERLAFLPLQSAGAAGKEDLGGVWRNLVNARFDELRLVPIVPDFHGQVAQVFMEVLLRQTRIALNHGIDGTTYGDRLSSWWTRWSESAGEYRSTPEELHDAVEGFRDAIQVSAPGSPFDRGGESFRLELWVRHKPGTASRVLVRWATSEDRETVGVRGKNSEIDHDSYLATVRTFCEGRPQHFDVADLEVRQEREGSVDRYSWRSFFAVPVTVDNVPVGVLTLASSVRRDESGVSGEWVRENLVGILSDLGARLLKPQPH